MASSTPKRIQIYGFAQLPHNRVDTVMAVRIREPPIVGVPFLTRWVCGPSVRTACPHLSAVSLRIVHGPNIRENAKAVNAAMTARNVVY